MTIFARAMRALRAWWPWRRQVSDPAPATPNAPPRRQRANIHDVHAEGEFYFKDDILDQLDRYFDALPGLKRADRQAYDFFSKVGAVVMPSQMMFEIHNLSPIWTTALPSAGALAMVGKEAQRASTGKLHAKLLYFQRFDPKSFQQLIEAVPAGHALYTATAFFEDRQDPKMRPIVVQFAVSVGPTGAVRALRTLQIGQAIRTGYSRSGPMPTRGKNHGTRKRAGAHLAFQAPVRRWGFDPHLVGWARENGFEVQDHLSKLFVICCRNWERATEGSMTRVSVSKGALCASFSVNIQRTPYFFKDRDVRDNRRKKIFHIVRAHERDLASGRTTSVKMHFRGARQFAWNGYDVLISVPGWHHSSLLKLNMAGIDVDEDEADPPGFIDMDEAGARVRDHLHGDFRH